MIPNLTDVGVQGCALALYHLNMYTFSFFVENHKYFNLELIKETWINTLRDLKIKVNANNLNLVLERKS